MKKKVFDNENKRYIEQTVIVNDIIQTIDVEEHERKPVNYDAKGRYDYIGYLSVPDVNINRGFVSLTNPYNHVDYNIMLIEGTDMPDKKYGNVIIAGHNGHSSFSYFNELHNLQMGASAIIDYNNKKYTYKLVDVYDVPKVGTVNIKRNMDASVLTLITCTYKSNTKQTVFIFELSNVE
jgi:LPXTG-site transpeptidase (sortase) family protein